MATITITIDVPDGATVGFGNSGATAHAVDPPAPEAPQDDPWGGGGATTSGRQESSATASSGASGGSSGRPASGVVVDDRGKQWTFNAPGAPDCQCGEPAAQVKGKTNGKSWSQWRCAKAYGDDWKSKCQFSEFVGNR